ncbi:MAG: polyprenyl synthetase family protein [Actinomycetota bacterium]|nr:polyprenyl synthetase family protein [Actinomycetota bacterium]
MLGSRASGKGEFDQLKKNKNLDQGEKYYFQMINEKTSSLFKASCVLGGLLSDSGPREINGLARFGKLLGIAFQINDDLLDIDIGESQDIGKPVGNDLRQGNLTLPVIYALKNKEFKKTASQILENKPLTEQNIEKILKMIDSTRAADIARAKFKTI